MSSSDGETQEQVILCEKNGTKSFGNYRTGSNHHSSKNNNLASQLAKYLTEIEESSTVSGIDFWSVNKSLICLFHC